MVEGEDVVGDLLVALEKVILSYRRDLQHLPPDAKDYADQILTRAERLLEET